MKPIFTTIAMALAVVAFLAAQDAATKGKAKAKGEGGFGAQWAGQGASLARAMPAAQLISVLHEELVAAQA